MKTTTATSHAPLRLVHLTTEPSALPFMGPQTTAAVRAGYTVEAISSPGERLERFGRQHSIRVHAVRMHRRITPLADLVALVRIALVLCKGRFHLVHAHTPKAGLLGMLAAWIVRVPVRIYHIHGMPLLTARGPRRWLLWLSDRVACRLAHQVLCVSHSVRAEAIAAGLCPADKVQVLGAGSACGVDAQGHFSPDRFTPAMRRAVRAQFGLPSEAVVVGYVGRLVRDKGLVEWAAAWQPLRSRFPHLHCLLVGEAEPQDPIPVEVLESLHADPRVHFTGHLADTAPVYAALDLLVLPTYREGLPTVVLEAAAMGVTVVATRIPGCIDAVVDGQTGTHVAPRDAAELAAAVARYLLDPSLRARHAAAARERVLREFRPAEIAEATLALYRHWLERRGVARAPARLPHAVLRGPHTRSRSREAAPPSQPHSADAAHHGAPRPFGSETARSNAATGASANTRATAAGDSNTTVRGAPQP